MNAAVTEAEASRTPAVFTIAANQNFVTALAAGLMARHGATPEGLAPLLILLPTRRACRTLREAFLQLSGGAPLLLPRMRPIGDVDEDDLALSGGLDVVADGGAALDVPPAISEMNRQLLLSRLILKQQPDASPEQAVMLATALARLLDQAQTERLSFDRLAGLAPEDLSDHWQKTLEFLRIVTAAWPAILEERGVVDPATHRNLLLDRQRAQWQTHPPEFPVIAAGSTGSIPATADLLETVAGLPNGMVILPGLDRSLDTETWGAVQKDEGHPQFGLARLLQRMEMERSSVKDWEVPMVPSANPDDGNATSAPPQRVLLAAEALRPASTTEAWARRKLSEEDLHRALRANEPISGVQVVTCRDPGDEARAIALAFRKSLETEGQTAALVTPDRELGRRVAAEMQRWDIQVDDSAGTPLTATPPAAFLLQLAETLTSNLAPAELLGLLKHPLTALGQDRPSALRCGRALELAALRGARPAPGIDGLYLRLKTAADDTFHRHKHRIPDAEKAVGWLADCLGGSLQALTSASHPVSDLVRQLVDIAERVAETDQSAGAQRLWAHDEGEALAGFIDDLVIAAADLPPMTLADFAPLLSTLMAGRAVRPRYGAHPRLAIYGPLEARLHHADLMILGGLNEGTWPPEPPVDPWMSRPMRRSFGLPAPERRIGLSAHDFAQAFCARRVLVTRSEKSGGSPTVPSRWLQKIETLLKGGLGDAGIAEAHWQEPDLQRWAMKLDRPPRIQTCARPQPKPPVTARPRKLSVTQIEKWLRDPYTIFARYILQLDPLDDIDADPGAIDRGNILHKVFETFIEKYNGKPLPPDAGSQLKKMGESLFQKLADSPGVAAIWWPRFVRAADAFVSEEAERRETISTSHVEIRGSTDLHGPEGPFRLTGTADRIDLLKDGSAVILDYKTGSRPRAADVDTGFNPQLALEGLILQRGGFKAIGDRVSVSDLDYWQVSGGKVPLKVTTAGKLSAAELIDDAADGLRRLIRTYDTADQAYVARPASDYALAFNDYEHLARIREWAVTEAAE